MSNDHRRFPSTITLRISEEDHQRIKRLVAGSPVTEHGLARHLLLLGLDQVEADQARNLFLAPPASMAK